MYRRHIAGVSSSPGTAHIRLIASVTFVSHVQAAPSVVPVMTVAPAMASGAGTPGPELTIRRLNLVPVFSQSTPTAARFRADKTRVPDAGNIWRDVDHGARLTVGPAMSDLPRTVWACAVSCHACRR